MIARRQSAFHQLAETTSQDQTRRIADPENLRNKRDNGGTAWYNRWVGRCRPLTKERFEMSENTGDISSKGMSRRDALKAGAATAGTMAFFGAMVPGVAGADASSPWQQADYMNFARLVNTAWKKPSVRQQYHDDPTGVLKQYNITLPPGTPPPTIPPAPKTALGYSTTGSKTFRTQATGSVAHWDLHITNLSGPGISISSLACIACPVSSFSSLSNG
jgi:hypothetical protein